MSRRVTTNRSKRTPDPAMIDARVASGGLAFFDGDENLLHLTPPDTARSLRFFVSRLLRSRTDDFPQTIAVTSALAGEGVTFIARSLAAIIAHDLDRKVCLVETNWWRRSEHDGTSSDHPGLAEVLDGSVEVHDALTHTSDEHLAILTSGNVPLAYRPVVVVSQPFADAIAMLTKSYDTVILDVPPVLRSNEATAISAHADAVTLVVRHGVTTEHQVEMAMHELSGNEILGVVINRTSTNVPKFLRRFTVPV